MRKFNFFNAVSQIKSLSLVAAPISIGMLSQNIMTVVDSLMVSGLGITALAAIGLGGFIILIANASTVGFSTYVQRQTAYHIGSGISSNKYNPLIASIFVALVFLPIISLILFQSLPAWVSHLHEDPDVISQLEPYVEIRLWALTFIALNFSFRGYCAATQLLRFYLMTTFFMQLLNIILNYIFIFGHFGFPEMGVEGAALASLLSTFSGVILYYFTLMKKIHMFRGISACNLKYEFQQIVRILIPYGIQQMFFIAGFAVMLWIIGLIDTQSLAIASVVLNVSIFFFLPAIGYGIAAAGAVSRALGSQQYQSAVSISQITMGFVFVFFSTLSLPVLFFTQDFMGLFFAEQNTLQQATEIMKVAALLFGLEALSLVLLQVLFAVNRGIITTLSSATLQWAIFLPLIYYWVSYENINVYDIWVTLAVYRLVSVIIFYLIWNSAQKDLNENLLKTT